jgi:hypothetical protein
MSYANFGPNYEVVQVINQAPATVKVPTSLLGAAVTSIDLIRLNDGVTALPLTVGPGTWIFRGKCFFNPPAGAVDVQYAQVVIVDTDSGDVVASSACLGAAKFVAAQDNVLIPMNVDVIIIHAVANTYSLQIRSNGVTAECQMGPIGGLNSTLRAYKISA